MPLRTTMAKSGEKKVHKKRESGRTGKLNVAARNITHEETNLSAGKAELGERLKNPRRKKAAEAIRLNKTGRHTRHVRQNKTRSQRTRAR